MGGQKSMDWSMTLYLPKQRVTAGTIKCPMAYISCTQFYIYAFRNCRKITDTLRPPVFLPVQVKRFRSSPLRMHLKKARRDDFSGLSSDAFYSHSDAQSANARPVVLEGNRFPFITFAAGARACIFFPESPMGLTPDVAKGIMVFPLKS